MDINQKEKEENKEEPADFERAISATGFGKFNYILLIIALPSCFGTLYETSTMSYILPSAECDLKLTLIHKGILNAITYAGMITSAIFWGYMADTQGRKKLLVFGYILDAICVICGSLSQNVYMLMSFKYLGGFLVCGPFAVLMSYVIEFQGTNHRGRIMMVMGMYFSIGTLSLPLLAWSILPQSWELIIIENVFVIHSWHVLITICALPSLISGIAIMFLPETPKFLMSQGRNEEALEVFRKIYALNTNKPKDTYPITNLVMEVPQKIKVDKLKPEDEPEISTKQRIIESLRIGLKQIKPMFSKPYLGHSILVYTIQYCILQGLNTIRLWLPQLFSSIADFEQNYLETNSTDSSNLCAMLAYAVNKTAMNTQSIPGVACDVAISDQMYINTIIVGLSGMCGYLVAGAVINALGNKGILIIGLGIAGTCGIALYWASNSLMTVILSSLYVTVGSVSSQALLGVTVTLFPTSLRTMIVSLTMMFGRMGALLGNVMFPFFLSFGCLPPFLLVGCVMIISSGLSILLPKTHKTALK